VRLLRHFRYDLAVLLAALIAAGFYGGAQALGLTAILIVVEVVFSFDNATINARTLGRMSRGWQRAFLTAGVIVAVFGMRVVFPLAIVSVTAGINPWRAVDLALQKGNPHHPGTYGYLLDQAHALIAAFGGTFLLLLALEFLMRRREERWLGPIERPLQAAGRLPGLPVAVAGAVLAVLAEVVAPTTHEERQVLIAGLLGIVAYILVNGLAALLPPPSRGSTAVAAGRAGLALFVYLEVVDASFSFDTVIGAFAITPDPVIIALGLGVGALLIRSLTTYLVREGTLGRYRYLEHGAHWAILALAVILLLSVRWTIPDVATGLIGIALIAAAFASSLVANRAGGPAGDTRYGERRLSAPGGTHE
jgi:hypothetical protein